jgi:hypothetical protein
MRRHKFSSTSHLSLSQILSFLASKDSAEALRTLLRRVRIYHSSFLDYRTFLHKMISRPEFRLDPENGAKNGANTKLKKP